MVALLASLTLLTTFWYKEVTIRRPKFPLFCTNSLFTIFCFENTVTATRN